MASLDEFLANDEVLPQYQEEENPEITTRQELCDFFAEKLNEINPSGGSQRKLIEALSKSFLPNERHDGIRQWLLESLNEVDNHTPENGEEDQYLDPPGDTYGSNFEAFGAAKMALHIVEKLNKSYRSKPAQNAVGGYLRASINYLSAVVSQISPTQSDKHPSKENFNGA